MLPLGSLLFSKGKQRSSKSRGERGWEERRKGGRGWGGWNVLYERRLKIKKASVACVYLSGLTS